jgi:hypothetical protein
MSTSAHTRAAKRSREVVPALCLLLASLTTFAFAAYPMYVIRPFTEQAPAALKRALWVLLYDKPLSFILAFLISALALFLWRRSGWIARILLISAIGITIVAAASTWINPYEHMFHPLGEPKYLAADKAVIDPSDMVIAVTLNKESRAYPIREMGYHHVVNDRLHQLPIVVTY